MCGLAGSFGSDADVGAMLDRLRHRGPDGRGLVSAGDALHGHVRLALLDLTPASAQPFAYRHGLLSYNGELWNYRDLRSALKLLGHTFVTTGDTEVVAAALSEWGLGALDRLDGMFALAWSEGPRHWLARDRYGKVPLYLLRSQGWTWASERKAWLVPLSGAAKLVPAGHWVDLVAGTVQPWTRLDADAGVDPSPAEVEAALRVGVEKRLHADAPVCCLISGGLDSSLVLALAKAAHPGVVAYTGVHDERSADLKAARLVCRELGVPLHEVRLPAVTTGLLQEALRVVEVSLKAQIEIAVLALPLARAIASDGFKACLSGEGADELFGGYGAMIIASRHADDAGWRDIRAAQVRKMARANFLRCNKVFLAAGVECRLPFLDRALVSMVLGASKAGCPPGKGLLKAAARSRLPRTIVDRVKQTFQGGAGIIASAQAACGPITPQRAYNGWARATFGALVRD